MYRVVQTTGPDGKNLLKLLPIPKASGSFVPIVQPSTMANNSKASVSNPVHLTFKTQLSNTAAPSSVKIPVFQAPNPGKIILARTLDKQESLRAGSEKESLTPNSGANSQSSCVSVDKLSLQNTAVTNSSRQSSTAYMVLNTKTLPVAMKTSSLLSGHHLQIPADAEVKSVPASFLPPAIQQKILAETATNVAEGGGDSAKMPTVIYVSPVKTVRTALTSLRAIWPKAAPDVSQTLLMTAPQKGSGPSPGTVTSDGQPCQQAPMKWVVQEGPQTSMPCLIPVKSSNNVASKILKTLSDMKNAEANSASILSLCSSSPGGSQTKIPPIKDNALVMYNGKVYLLTKRSSDILSGPADNQASSSSDVSGKKEAATLIDSTAVSKITSEVVNLVFAKPSGMVLSQKDPNSSPGSKKASPTGLRNDVKSAPAAPVPASATQQDSTVNHRKSLLFNTSISSGVTADGAQENMCPNGKDKTHSAKAARAALLQAKREGAFSDNCQKVQCGKMDSPRKLIQIKQQEKPHWKQYLELRKKFGLCKEERVYLKRIPLRSSCEELEERVCSSNSLKRKSDSLDSASVDVETTNQPQECVNEEKKTVDPEENLTKKKKVKSSAASDTGKRRRTSVKSSTGPSSDSTSSSSSVHSRSPSPLLVLPQQSISTGFAVSSLGRDSEQDLDSQYSDIPYPSIPVLVSAEEAPSVLEGSFRNDAFPLPPPDLDETIRDERIERLKQQLRAREAALEEMRRKMQQS